MSEDRNGVAVEGVAYAALAMEVYREAAREMQNVISRLELELRKPTGKCDGVTAAVDRARSLMRNAENRLDDLMCCVERIAQEPEPQPVAENAVVQ